MRPTPLCYLPLRQQMLGPDHLQFMKWQSLRKVPSGVTQSLAVSREIYFASKLLTNYMLTEPPIYELNIVVIDSRRTLTLIIRLSGD